MKTVAFVRTTNIYDDSRATKEIDALLDGGYKVVILGWDRNGEAEEKTKSIFANQNVECRFFHCLLPTGIGMRNIDKLLKWVSWTKKELRKIYKEYISVYNAPSVMGVKKKMALLLWKYIQY